MPDATESAALVPPQGGATTTTELPEPNVPITTATSQPDEPAPSEPEPKAKPEAKPEAKRDYAAERKQERIDKLTAEKAELNREIARLKSGQSTDAAARQAEITAEATKLAQEEAGRIAAWNTFTGALNTAIAEGQKEFGAEKFDKSVAALRELQDKTNPNADTAYLGMLQAVLDTGAAPKVIRMLGDDPNEAARIMGLTPTKMGVELGKLAFRDAGGVSDAPKPITPITGVGRNHVAIAAEDPERADGLDMRVWMERRSKHVSEMNSRAGRRVIP